MAKHLTPEDIGAALGRLANRIDAWKKQRDELIDEGERLVGIASGYVSDLRGQQTSKRAATKSARKGKGGRPKGMKMSEETKAKLRAAWKRRKAQMAQSDAPKAAAKKRRS